MRRLSGSGEDGFTLVEVMVTVFVVAIGLLSAAALQAVSKKAAFDALQRSTATVIAQDMLERIRSNKAQVSTYAQKGAALTAAPTAPNCGRSVACTETTLVDYDLAQWWSALDGASEQITDGADTKNAGGLYLPTGCIRSNGNLVEVVIAWRGMTAIEQSTDASSDDPTADACGVDSYPADSPNLSYRRVLRLRAHV